MGVLVIHQPGAIETQGQTTLTVDFLGKQHAPYIGVINDRNLRAFRILFTGLAALKTIFGVFQAVHVTAITDYGSTKTNTNPRFVHHLEHVFQTLMGFANQVTVTRGVVTEAQCR